jgi:transcription termination/antitermination protein NusG
MEQKAWYIVHTQTGYEEKVKRTLEQQAETQGLKDKVFQVLVPTEEVVEVKQNKRSVRKRKFFPGYVLVELILDSQTYWFVKNTSGATGFLGDPKPVPLREEEIQGILELTDESAHSKPKPAVVFERGENIRIIEGPFKHFIGVVEEVNEPKAKVKVMVTVFDRPTPVELDFLQVEKI